MTTCNYKTIKINSETYKELTKLGDLADTFDTVISKLIQESRNSKGGG